jgi:nitroreductase
MDVYEAITRRRSIRRFKDRPVPDDVLEKCVDAGRLAPCGRNHQVCEYIIVNDEPALNGVFKSIISWAGLPPAKGAPPPENRPRAYIVILINRTLEMELDSKRGRVTPFDVGMAVENIILTALEQGIGSCPFLMFKESRVKEVLNIPDSHDVALLIAMGYPDESPVAEVSTGSVAHWVDEQGVRHIPKRKLEDITHHNEFV